MSTIKSLLVGSLLSAIGSTGCLAEPGVEPSDQAISITREIEARCRLEIAADEAGRPQGRAACDAFISLTKDMNRCTSEMKNTNALGGGACWILEDSVKRAARSLSRLEQSRQ